MASGKILAVAWYVETNISDILRFLGSEVILSSEISCRLVKNAWVSIKILYSDRREILLTVALPNVEALLIDQALTSPARVTAYLCIETNGT